MGYSVEDLSNLPATTKEKKRKENKVAAVPYKFTEK